MKSSPPNINRLNATPSEIELFLERRTKAKQNRLLEAFRRKVGFRWLDIGTGVEVGWLTFGVD